MAIAHVQEPALPDKKGQFELITKPKDGDYIELRPGKNDVDVRITFGQHPTCETVTSPLQLAFWIENANDSKKHGPVNCLPKVPAEEYMLRRIPEGSHRVSAALWRFAADVPIQQQNQQNPKSPLDLKSGHPFDVVYFASITFHVRIFEDFSATYSWQFVHPWHRLPPGLEIALDMSGGGDRKARIPATWKWDAHFDDPRDVVRVDVEASTTVAQLLQKLGCSHADHQLVWIQPGGTHQHVLEPDWTAQQVDLFRYGHSIHVQRKSS